MKITKCVCKEACRSKRLEFLMILGQKVLPSNSQSYRRLLRSNDRVHRNIWYVPIAKPCRWELIVSTIYLEDSSAYRIDKAIARSATDKFIRAITHYVAAKRTNGKVKRLFFSLTRRHLVGRFFEKFLKGTHVSKVDKWRYYWLLLAHTEVYRVLATSHNSPANDWIA